MIKINKKIQSSLKTNKKIKFYFEKFVIKKDKISRSFAMEKQNWQMICKSIGEKIYSTHIYSNKSVTYESLSETIKQSNQLTIYTKDED